MGEKRYQIRDRQSGVSNPHPSLTMCVLYLLRPIQAAQYLFADGVD